MKTSRIFMPLLTELAALGDESCYKHVTPNGVLAISASVFNRTGYHLALLSSVLAWNRRS